MTVGSGGNDLGNRKEKSCQSPMQPARLLGALNPSNSYLVDPASRDMLVSKIKPCMCRYNLYTGKLRMAR